ncbi:MAG: HYR domain-containing protein, partial [Crocinitomicaceae bacterium]
SITGSAGQDFAEAVYSTDGGTTWNIIGSALPISAAWTNTTRALPASLNGTSFDIGFRFTYDDANIFPFPLSVDNVLITGTDTIPPVINCLGPLNLAVQANCTAVMQDYTKTNFTLSDNCNDSVDVVVTQNIPEFTVLAAGPGGTQTVILTATDQSGNSSQCSFTLNIIDATLPVPVCPADTSVYVDASCDAILPDYTSFVVSTDNCSTPANIGHVQSPAPGITINGANIVTPITMTATDEAGNSATCSFNMTTIDTIVTTIICPSDTNLAVDNGCNFTLGDYTSGALLTDNCESLGNLMVTQSPPSGTLISADQTITLTVIGGAPAIPQSCTFNGLLIDTLAPAIICPPGATHYVNNSCLATLMDFTAGAVVTENCSSPSAVTQTPIAGTLVGLNPTLPITLSVSDTAGNIGTCQLFVAVIDTLSPNIVCPVDQTEPANTSCQATLGDYTSLASPSDNCSTSGNITVTQSPAPGTSFTGTQVVTLTATDESSNTGTCTFNVSVDDQTAPVVTCPANQSVGTTTNCYFTMTDFTGLASATDNCTPSGMISFTQSPAVGSIIFAGVQTVTITGTDASGNAGTCTFDLTVVDQTDPVFNVCPPTQTVIVDATCSGPLADYTSLAAVQDNCSSGTGITLTQSPIAGTSISSPTLVTLTATDQAGNSETCSFTVITSDTTSPSVTCPSDQIVAINASCGYSMPDLTGLVTGTDNCSAFANMTVSQNPAVGSAESGVTPVIITLTDQSGNSTTCTTNVLPDDVTPPTITCPTSSTASAGTSCDFALTNFGSLATVTDNCGTYTLSQTPAVGTLVPVGTNQITLTVTDAGGNSASCDFSLFVSETELPIIDCPNDTVTCDPVVFYSLPTFSDNCEVELNQTDGTGYSSGSTFPIGITDLFYQAVDTSGNIAGCNFRVEVLEYPSDAIIAIDTVALCGDATTLLEADPVTSGTGEWTVSTGAGDFNNELANITAVNNIAFGTNMYTWTVSTAFCGSQSDSIVVIRDENPIPTSISEDTIYICSDSIVNLQADAASAGSGVWTVSPQASVFMPNSNTTLANITNDGWYTFTWTVSNGSCPQTSDSVAVFHSKNAAVATSSDSSICVEDGIVQLSANALLPNQAGSWYFTTGSGDIENPNSTQTEVNNLQNGVNRIVYEVSNDNCPNETDTVIIIASVCEGFNPVFPTVITPNFDGRNDLFVIEYLELIHPDCYVTIFNRWGDVVYESVGYADPWDGTHNGEPLTMGTYFYRIELNDAEGTVYTGDISIIR